LDTSFESQPNLLPPAVLVRKRVISGILTDSCFLCRRRSGRGHALRTERAVVQLPGRSKWRPFSLPTHRLITLRRYSTGKPRVRRVGAKETHELVVLPRLCQLGGGRPCTHRDNHHHEQDSHRHLSSDSST